MNRLKSSIKELSWKPYSRFRGENIPQTRDQTINYLLGFYLFSVIAAFLLAVIQISGIPAKWGFLGVTKDLLGPLSGVIAVLFGREFIRDVLVTELDAATKKIEGEVKSRFFEDKQKILEQIDESIIKENLDTKYLAYLKQNRGADELRLQEVSSILKEEYSENRSAFEAKLDVEFEGNKNIREVRCIIHNLTDGFLHQLAVKGVAEVLHLEIEDALERTEYGKDLYLLYIDIYAYLSAWLICSIDNDMGSPMPIGCIGMRYTGRCNTPDKEIYKNVIQTIGKIIADGRYATFKYYPTSDPLSSKSVKSTIINYLNQLIGLIEKYPLEAVKF
jgi:hypothetical protein